MSKFNEEMKIPYVSKEVCKYLRDTYNLSNVIYQVVGEVKDSAFSLGRIVGMNAVIERLEAIAAQQEENDGIH